MTVLNELFQGFSQSLIIFFSTLVFAVPLGFLICFGSMSKLKVLKSITKAIVAVVRGTPLMLQLILVCYGPGLININLSWRVLMNDVDTSTVRLIIAVITFSLNYAAYFSEIFRGGIESIPKGQYEAGLVLGMNKRQIFNKVVLMQVIKRIVPPMSNEIITLIKDTSLAQIITVHELTMIADQLVTRNGGALWPLLTAGLIYFVFNAVVTFFLNILEKKLKYIKV